MSDKSDKSLKKAVVAFKVEEELANLLNQLPNKSEFIRQAIASQLGVACPLCQGKGVVSRGVHDHYESVIQQQSDRNCDGCGDHMHLSVKVSDLDADTRNRLEQYFSGGPLYCDGCYEKAPSCEDCGWHISEEQVDAHHREVHPD